MLNARESRDLEVYSPTRWPQQQQQFITFRVYLYYVYIIPILFRLGSRSTEGLSISVY